jgi:hypothetical protein
MGDPSAFVLCRDFFQAGLVHGGVFIARLGVIQDSNVHPTFKRGIDRIDDGLQFILVDGNVQRPLAIHRTLDKPQQTPEQTVFQPLPRGIRPGFDGQVLVGADQRVELGKLALERLAGRHCAIEDDTLVVRLTIVGGDRHFQKFTQLRRINAAIGQVDSVMDRHPRIDRVIGPAKFL